MPGSHTGTEWGSKDHLVDTEIRPPHTQPNEVNIFSHASRSTIHRQGGPACSHSNHNIIYNVKVDIYMLRKFAYLCNFA